MSVVPMKRMSVIAMKRDRKAVLEYLQALGVMQVSIRRKEDDVFRKTDMTNSQQVFLKNAAKAEEALTILKHRVPEKTSLLSSLEGRKVLTPQEFGERVHTAPDALEVCGGVIDLDRELSDSISNVPKLEDQKTALMPWLNFDLPLDLAETRKTAVFTGTVQGSYTRDALYTEVKALSNVDTFEADIISSDATQTCIFLVCEKKDQAAMREALRRMNFASPPVSGMNPSERAKQIEGTRCARRSTECSASCCSQGECSTSTASSPQLPRTACRSGLRISSTARSRSGIRARKKSRRCS